MEKRATHEVSSEAHQGPVAFAVELARSSNGDFLQNFLSPVAEGEDPPLSVAHNLGGLGKWHRLGEGNEAALLVEGPPDLRSEGPSSLVDIPLGPGENSRRNGAEGHAAHNGANLLRGRMDV